MNLAIDRRVRWSRRHRIIKATAALLAIAAVAACGRGERQDGPALVSEAAGLRLELRLRPDPPRLQDNVLAIRLLDADGRPVEGATITARAVMPAMATMAEMRSGATVKALGDGRYEASFDLQMQGTWRLELDVRAGERAVSAVYSATTGSSGLTEVSVTASGGGAAARAVVLPAQRFPEPTLAALRRALAAAEQARQRLAQDQLEGIAEPAATAAAAFRDGAAASGDAAPEIRAVIAEGAAAADSLARAGDLVNARRAFGEMSRALLLLANCDPRLAQGWQAFTCPMTETFPKWLQPAGPLANPYMGREMTTCGSPTDFAVPPPASTAEVEAHVEQAHGGDVAYYTCSMHPSVRKQEPGACPICSMNLVPVTREEAATGTVTIAPERRQEIGVRTARVEKRRFEDVIRAAGRVTYDETRFAEVTVKVGGYVGQLYADATGEPVRRGQPLFTLYSPELYAGQQEYLAALASQQRARSSGAPDRADYLVAAARQRLRLWDVSEAQVERLARTGEALQYVPILSPASGHVVEKLIVAGAAVEPGMRLYRIAALDRVWVEAEVYEADLPLVAVGQPAKVTLSYLPGRTFAGRVAFVYPSLAVDSRTGRVRIELANPGLALKPEMYADVELRADLGERLAVPESAVLYTGPRRFVFLDQGEGKLTPRQVQVGRASGDWIAIESGLQEGDVVVTSANFLVAAESRLKLALEQWQ